MRHVSALGHRSDDERRATATVARREEVVEDSIFHPILSIIRVIHLNLRTRVPKLSVGWTFFLLPLRLPGSALTDAMDSAQEV